MKGAELEAFCKDMAILIRAGMTLEEMIEFMAQDSEDDHMKQVIKKIKAGLKDGKSIDEAMQATQEFPEYMTSMIQIGVTSNHLVEVLELLMEIYHREDRLKQNLKRAINYPIYLCSIMCIVMLFLVLKVIPTVNEIFLSWTGELTQGAKLFMQLGKWIGICTEIVFIGVIILSVIGIFLAKTKIGQKISVRLAGYTSVSERISTAHFAWVMGIVLESGLSIEQSLEISLSVIENKAVQQRVRECLQMIKDKELFEYALVESKIFTRKITRLIIKSCQNGQLQQTIKQVGEECERDVQYTLENKVLAIETISVGITSILIGSILMTVMLPLISILLTLI